jgi:cell division protein FtsZ
LSELITEHGLINLDCADVKALMSNAGSALMGIGRASGDDRAAQAAQQAIESPLIEVSIDGAKGVLFNVTGGYDMSMSEIQEAAEIITSSVSPEANIIFGATLKPELEDELIITVIATGFDSAYFHEQAAQLEVPVALNQRREQPAVADAAVEAINLDLDQVDVAASFAEDTTHNIWSDQPEENDESDTPAFLRRRKKNKNTDES